MKRRYFLTSVFSFFFVGGVSSFCASAQAATYYVRTDGGTSAQCTGQVDAAYPGSGTGQACAFAHPAWALGAVNSNGVMVAGDTLIVGSGEYMIGYGMPNNPGGSTGWPYESVLDTVPAGTSPTNKTKIYGKGWDSGCTGVKSQLWGTQRTWQVLSISGNTEVSCLDITDHSACIENGPIDGTVDGFPTQCVRSTYPQGPWANTGIGISQGSSNVTLNNVDIHGLASKGIMADRVGNMDLINVRIVANGFVGWDSDTGAADDSYTGTITLTGSKIEWNGCGERYPLTTTNLSSSIDKHHCWSQDQGGFGDGIGLGDGSPGNWNILDSSVSWNTSDGVDLAHGNGNSTLRFFRSKAEGNAGNQFKSTGVAYIENSVIIGNCNFFQGQTFTSTKSTSGATVGFNHCRAFGNAVSINFPLASNFANISNSTLLGNGDVMIILGTSSGCSGGTPRISAYNNIIYGGIDFTGSDGHLTALWYTESPCSNANFVQDYNIVYNTKDNNQSCSGTHSKCGVNPIFSGTIKQGPSGNYYSTPDYAQQLKLKSTSPAINAANPGIALIGTSNDYLNNARGVQWDMGAYEYGTGAPDTTPPTLPANFNLAATSPSQSSISLSWNPATDNVGVTGYIVERCQGSDCSNFAQVGTPTSSPFVDSGLTANTFYNYHVRATDAAGNLSGWSNVVGATTQSGGGSTCSTVNVNSVSQLVNAINTANSNPSCSTTILVADGTYTLTAMLPISAPNMTIKSQSGNRDAVILQGDTMTSSASVKIIFRVDANNFTAESMTLQRVGWHLIQVVGENNRDNFTAKNMVFRNAWEQMIKASYVDTNTNGSDNGLVENSLFEFTAGQAGQYYTGGIDAHNAKNWVVSGNTFKNIISPSGSAAEHAIHFWSNSADTLVEKNLIINCDRGIGFGLVQGRGHLRGIIRNNMIYHAAGNGSFADVAIEADESPNTQIYNNTIFMQNNYSNAIEYRFPLSSGIVIRNNLTNKSIQARDGATATLSNNIANAQASWFVNASQGDLHLASGSTSANNAGTSISGLTNDYDGDTRPQGGGIDVGADEYGSNNTPTSCNTVTPANFSDSAYNGYGAPYDVFAGNAQLIDAKCIASDTRTIQATIGKVNDTTRIVYTKGYYYDPGTNNWAQFTGTCTGLLNGEWCAGPITTTITDPDISTASANTPVYMVGMTCSMQGGNWKCGCRDTACANFSWQVQGAGR